MKREISCDKLDEPYLPRGASPIQKNSQKIFEFSGIFTPKFGIDYNTRRLTLQIQGILVS
jgi:hypothetical protein